MKTKYKNVYLDNTPVRNAGADDLILSGSINKAGELTSITSVRTGGINGKNLVSASKGDEVPKIWGYYGHDKTAIEMEVCAEYCKYIIENIANSNYSDKCRILLSNAGLSLTTLQQDGEWFDEFGSDRFLNLSSPSSFTANVGTKAQYPDADCTNVLKYLDILLSIQNELVEYATQQTIPVMDAFAVVGYTISATESMLEVLGAKDVCVLGPDENSIFIYTVSEVDGKNVYTTKSQPKDPKLTVVKISEDDLLFILEYIGVTQKMGPTTLISTDLLLSGIDQESGSGGDDPIMDVN